MKATVDGFANAENIAHAIALLAQSGGEARLIAGGQSLVAAINLGLVGHVNLIDINGISALRGIRIEGDRLMIGALTRHAELATDPLIARHAPLLAKAVPLIAHAAIRNRGSLGGSLAHADPAAELPACILALAGTMHIEGPDGPREVQAEDFFHDIFETALEENDILTAISLPIHAAPLRKGQQIIREISRRRGDFAMAGLALVASDHGHRAAFFGAGPTPILARNVMAALDRGDHAAALAAVSKDIAPLSDSHASASYRQHIATVLLQRCLQDLTP